jgi:hypothetical protein
MIAQKIFEREKIPYLSLDWLVMGFTHGMPDHGIHDLLLPDEIAERLWSFLQAMCESMLWTGEDHVIEGEAVLPELLSELLKKHPDRVRVCFVGYTGIDPAEKAGAIRRFSKGMGDWLSSKPDEYIRDHIVNMINHSRRIKSACETYGLRYVDTSDDFEGAVDQAVDYLLGDE